MLYPVRWNGLKSAAGTASAVLASLRVGLMCLSLFSAGAQPTAASAETENSTNMPVSQEELAGETPLLVRKPVGREIKGGETHTYSVQLRAGEYLEIVVEQRGIDLAVTLVAPDGEPVGAADSLNGKNGPEVVCAIAAVGGTYSVAVRPLGETAAPGHYKVRGNFSLALTQIEAALAIIEDVRAKVTRSQLRTSYLASKHEYYELYIDLLMRLHKQHPEAGYDGRALHASERARARSLLEILAQAGADIRAGASPQLLQRERTLQQQIDAVEIKRMRRLAGNPTEAQKAELEKERESLIEQYQELQAQLRIASPRYTALTQSQPLTLPEIQQQVLDAGTVLLEYSLGDERSYLWAVTKTGITSYELPPRADIEKAATAFRDVLTLGERASAARLTAAGKARER